MNIINSGPQFTQERLPDPATDPWRPREGDSAVQELLEQLARQNRRIQSLERLLATADGTGERSRVVTLQPQLTPRPRAVPVAVRELARTWSGWPSRPMPPRAMEPPPGNAHLDLKNTGAKVIAFALFGLTGADLEREVARVAEEQRRQGNFIPVFLSNARESEAFRRRGYMFEHVPEAGDVRTAADIGLLQPKLDFLEAKWGIDHFINLGHPKGSRIRREMRLPAERYREAKVRFAQGRFAAARRVLGDFTEDTLEAAKVVVVGTSPVNPPASIVVVSHRDHPGVEDGLRSIARQIKPGQFEVILVDNGNAALARLGRKIFGSCTIVEIGFNAGCSGARNAGARLAKSPRVIFLDDDGITEEGCISALIACMDATGAVAVRGRVMPLTAPHLKGAHYDLGAARVPALITCEGVSIWRRDAFLGAGGFDPLLAGHEGVALCARLWRFHGPAGFVYEPGAVLLHDYAPDLNATAAKNKRYKASVDYLDFLGLRWQEVNSGQLRFIADPMLGHMALQAPRRFRAPAALSVSFITTAKDARHFLAEYTASLKAQTSADFEVIFVDDHSEDGTAEEIERLWQNDPRMKVFANTGRGRGAALNEAMRHASGDVCLIADVDDLSVPARVSLTRAYFAVAPGSDCMSFVAFNETNPFRLGPPRSMFVDDLTVRQLFGMPVSFPTFAFRRESFPLAFDESLLGGIDCDWWFRNGAQREVKGQVVFYPAVYYREHAGQITALRKERQLAVRRGHVAGAYERVLGELGPVDARCIQALTETKQFPAAEKAVLTSWVAAFLQKNHDRAVYEPRALEQAMFEVLREINFVKAK